MKKNKIIYSFLLVGALLSSCSKDYLNVDPQSTINSEQLGSSSAATMGTLKGIFGSLRSYGITGYAGHEDYGHKSILSVMDLMGNDVIMVNLNWGGFNYNYTGRVMTNSRAHMPWLTYYTQIKNANIIINSIAENTDNSDLKAIRGQALALRGYFHFMLARIYGPTYVGNESALSVPINAAELSNKRNTVAEVYAQVQADLEDAVIALDGYNRGANLEMIDKSVAQGFLADVYLEMGKYEEAAKYANLARANYELLNAAAWQNGFYDIKQNETMWGADLNAELTTFVANFYSHFDNTNVGYAEGGNITIDKRLYDAMSPKDIRKNMYAGPDSVVYTVGNESVKYGPYVSFKFRDLTVGRTAGDYIYLRSAAMYYIEAEALARSGKEEQAKDVLYEITKTRAQDYVRSSKTGADLIDEIILQKRIELWAEGFAWFDLKRLKKGVVRNYTGSNHATYGKFDIPAGDNRFLFMIPQAEVDANPEILPNNPQ
ncbi:RagB/SusD family nutrient uptake outer membrane protein [Sphingobacterium rhinopitheci]|uniref:RagB/SusD family nutrient uptake outer membrane protein n=1 Tax=Sphingobacterium rhinopitheci TaxID=2781960 RepID=UPI001F52A2A4|nr:RagB/SusD family nutrient uptake outer membrane protein [Sphingobacterium rhinopitheci]